MFSIDQDDSEELEDEPFLVRVVREKDLKEKGTIADTGLHLAFYGPEVLDMSTEELATAWGYTEAELSALEAEGEHLVAVIYSPADSCGYATAEALATLICKLRPDVARFSEADYVKAIRMRPEAAVKAGLRDAQEDLKKVYGLRDPIFGAGRIPIGENEGEPPAFLIDQKILSEDNNPLGDDTGLPLDLFPDMPVVRRLPWPGEPDEDDDEDEEDEDYLQ